MKTPLALLVLAKTWTIANKNTEIFHQPIADNRVLGDKDCWHNLDLQSLGQEGGFLCVKTEETGLVVLLTELGQMLVYNLTPEECEEC